MTNEHDTPGNNDVPRPSEAAGAEVVRLRQAEGSASPADVTVESYFTDNLSDAYTDEEFSSRVHDLVSESQGDMNLAELLVARERASSFRYHPSNATLGQKTLNEKLNEIGKQIEDRKRELGESNTS